MRKKLVVVLTLSLLLCGVSLAVGAAPSVFVNGEALVSENPVVLENDRTLVPFRAIFETVNQEVYWNADDMSITSGVIWLQIDNAVATVNGENVTLDVPAKLINDVTYVPLRFIAESLDKEVLWDGVQFRVDINDKPVADEETDEDAVVEEDDSTTVEEADEDQAVEEADEDAVIDEDTQEQEDAEEETGNDGAEEE